MCEEESPKTYILIKGTEVLPSLIATARLKNHTDMLVILQAYNSKNASTHLCLSVPPTQDVDKEVQVAEVKRDP